MFHFRTEQRSALSNALCVALTIQSSHSSLGARRGLTIFRSIARLADSSCRSSLARGVHDSQHHVTQLPTVLSNKRRRRLIDTLSFKSKRLSPQNSFHPLAILLLISSILFADCCLPSRRPTIKEINISCTDKIHTTHYGTSKCSGYANMHICCI